MTTPVALVVAKAPVPGKVKTRLAAAVGEEHAARLAHAALLDTMDACETAFGPQRCRMALAGDLREVPAREAGSLLARLRGWVVLPQRGSTFGERLENAHVDVHRAVGGPVIQIGMDTPQVRPAMLAEIGALAAYGGPVLGPAHDGGWWVLASAVAGDVTGLREVPMSDPRTGRWTWELLCAAGRDVAMAPALRDVDDAEDAAHVAASVPLTRFARSWLALATGPAAGHAS